MSKLVQMSMVALAFGLSEALTMPASAADYTFHVPVNPTNIHEDVTTVRVTCEVRDQAGGIIGQQWTDLRNIPDDETCGAPSLPRPMPAMSCAFQAG